MSRNVGEIPARPGGAAEDTINWLSSRIARWLTLGLLAFGVECWLVFGQGNYGHQNKPRMILIAIVAGLIPPINRAFNWLWNVLAAPSAVMRRSIAMAIWIGSSLFLYWTLQMEGISFKPTYEDEFSYLTQIQMLAHGRFWMPALPLPEYFETFYTFVRPVYASMYFPGAAMMYVWPLLLHLPYFIAPLATGGLCAALVYLIFMEILDGASAILAVLLLLSLPMFRLFSMMAMAQIPTLALGLAMTWAVLKWRRNKRRGWLILLGTMSGWAAITRPADALCFAIVLAGVMAMDLKSKPLRTWIITAATVALPVLPFLVLQLIINRNVTGEWFTTPFGRYNDANYPGVFWFHSGPAPRHVSDLPQAQFFYEINAKGVIEQHQWKNLMSGLMGQLDMIRFAAVPEPFFWLILPMSLLAMWNRRLWAVWGMLPTFTLVLTAYAFSWVLPHYYIMVMPAVILLCVLPIRFLTDTFPNRAAMSRTMIAVAMIPLALSGMPQFDRLADDQHFKPPELRQIDSDLAREITGRAVVLFHFNRDALIGGKKVTNNPSVEPVFNADVAWPDEAAIIRAHDLNADVSAIGKPGDRDRALYEYYSRIDPRRVFYLYDRGGETEKLRRLGTATEMARKTAVASHE
ncbi:MAG: hypothetical protein ABSB42_12470 [Tepidisphaeraceae bacterium]|jgi:hypothetical protein